MDEFSIIRQFFSSIGTAAHKWPNSDAFNLQTGIGDDAAVFNSAVPGRLVASVDTMVEGRHFPKGYPADRVAHRALAAASSDLAAMGVVPVGCLLSLTLPQPDVAWLEAFSRKLSSLCDQWKIPLCGGDTTAGPLQISFTVLGWSAKDVVLRSGARPGDEIWICGDLGLAAIGLKLLDLDCTDDARAASALIAFNAPEPLLSAGLWLSGRVTSMIDVSDGLVSDLTHLCQSSSVGALLHRSQLESGDLDPPLTLYRDLGGDVGDKLDYILNGGDDYALLFTAAPSRNEELRKSPFKLRRIGQITSRHGVTLTDGINEEVLTPMGWNHFRD